MLHTKQTVDKRSHGYLFSDVPVKWNIYIIITVVQYTAKKATFAFHKVVRRQYSGEVGEFIIFWFCISAGFCAVYSTKDN